MAPVVRGFFRVGIVSMMSTTVSGENQAIPASEKPLLSPGGEESKPAVVVAGLNHTYPSASRVGSRKARRASTRSSGLGARPLSRRRQALSNISFTVQPGEIFGVLGPNGGGKTTLFRLLSTTLMLRESGCASVLGHDVRDDAPQVRRQMGVVFQMPSLDVKLTAHENLVCQGHLYGLYGSDLAQRIDRLLEQFQLSDRSNEYVESFSGGMRRRVELAKALLHDPRLLLLDEPSTGLDPGGRHDLWTHLLRLRDQLGVTIMLTTHLMEEADRCDRLAVLSQGSLIALDRPAKLKAMIGGDVVTIHPVGEAKSLCQFVTDRLAPWAEGRLPRVTDSGVRFEKQHAMEQIGAIAADLPGQIRSITVGQPTLEDVFLHLTGHTLYSHDA